MFRLKFEFYIGGVSIIIWGILIYLGFDLPMRDGRMPENPLDYASSCIIFGIIVIILTYFVDKYYTRG